MFKEKYSFSKQFNSFCCHYIQLLSVKIKISRAAQRDSHWLKIYLEQFVFIYIYYNELSRGLRITGNRLSRLRLTHAKTRISTVTASK